MPSMTGKDSGKPQQALAMALAIKRRRKSQGGIVRPMAKGGMVIAKDSHKRLAEAVRKRRKMAYGGKMDDDGDNFLAANMEPEEFGIETYPDYENTENNMDLEPYQERPGDKKKKRLSKIMNELHDHHYGK